MPLFKIEKIDKGWNKILEELAKVNKSHVDCGMLSTAGKTKEGFDLVALATVQEFGNDKIPSRPFMRTTFGDSIQKIYKFLEKEYDKILSGKTDTYTALETLGVWYTNRIKKQITSGPWVPNAPSTLLANWRKKHRGIITKGEALQNQSGFGVTKKPLIDTSVMRNSLTHIVVKS